VTAEDLTALRTRHQAYEDLIRTAPECRDQAADDRGDLLAYLAADPPGDELPIMCRRLSDGLAAISWGIFVQYGETSVAVALRGVRDPLPGELLPTGPLGTTSDGREATLRVVLSQDRPALAVYFGDTRVSSMVQFDLGTGR